MATWRPNIRAIIDECFDNMYGGAASDGSGSSESDDSGGKSSDESSNDVTTQEEGGDSSLTPTRETISRQVKAMPPLFEICAATPDSDDDAAISSDESATASEEVEEEEPRNLPPNVSTVDSPSSTILDLGEAVTVKQPRAVHQEQEQEPATKRKRQQQYEKATSHRPSRQCFALRTCMVVQFRRHFEKNDGPPFFDFLLGFECRLCALAAPTWSTRRSRSRSLARRISICRKCSRARLELHAHPYARHGNLRKALIDQGVTGTSQEIVDLAYFLLRNDGIFVGPSSALNVLGAVKMARQLGPGHTIVTILADGGVRYGSKLYNED